MYLQHLYCWGASAVREWGGIVKGRCSSLCACVSVFARATKQELTHVDLLGWFDQIYAIFYDLCFCFRRCGRMEPITDHMRNVSLNHRAEEAMAAAAGDDGAASATATATTAADDGSAIGGGGAGGADTAGKAGSAATASGKDNVRRVRVHMQRGRQTERERFPGTALVYLSKSTCVCERRCWADFKKNFTPPRPGFACRKDDRLHTILFASADLYLPTYLPICLSIDLSIYLSYTRHVLSHFCVKFCSPTTTRKVSRCSSVPQSKVWGLFYFHRKRCWQCL